MTNLEHFLKRYEIVEFYLCSKLLHARTKNRSLTSL